MNKLLSALLVVLCASHSVRARLLSSYFQSGMVLESYPYSASIFGRTRQPGSPVVLTLDGASYSATSDATGRWSIDLPPTRASFTERHILTVSSPNEAREVLRDVLFGTTLFCSGATPVTTDLTSALRFIPARYDATGAIAWGSSTAPFSAACAKQAHDLSTAQNVPVGAIDATNRGLSSLDVVRGATIQHFAWASGAANSVDEGAFRRAAERAAARNGYIVGADTLPRVIAHRGSASTCPENTMPSQEVARRGGAVWIEDDTHPTKDGVPIVMHDDKVDRTTNGKGAIRSLTLAEIKALDAGAWFSPVFAGTRVPTLEEQVSDLAAKGGNLLLELKSEHSVAELANIVEILRRYNMTERVIAQSFTVVDLERMYQVAPEIPLGLLTSNIDSDLAEVCKRLHLTHYNPSYGSVIAKPNTVKTLHDLGVAIYVWTPDTPALWQKMIDLGVDGIITNRAIELIGYEEGLEKAAVKEGLFDRAPPAANHGVKFYSI